MCVFVRKSIWTRQSRALFLPGIAVSHGLEKKNLLFFSHIGHGWSANLRASVSSQSTYADNCVYCTTTVGHIGNEPPCECDLLLRPSMVLRWWFAATMIPRNVFSRHRFAAGSTNLFLSWQPEIRGENKVVGRREGRKDARARNIFAQGKRRKESCLKVEFQCWKIRWRWCHDGRIQTMPWFPLNEKC